ncbi:MAG: rod-binding protein [Pseudomonadota bacterium]|nr:rod-binding protein [Pseudomonadota bacterium]
MNNNPIAKIRTNIDDQLLSINKSQIKKDSTLEDVAKEFESLFVYQMLKSARKAKLAESLFSNNGSETYESLLDQEYAKTISKNHSFGIADALLRQFGGKEK